MFALHVNPYFHLSRKKVENRDEGDRNSAKYQNNWTTQ
jgi:hypothetical protein